MKWSYPIAVVLCLMGMIYGYWGAFTHSGQYYYDEMDAMTPFFTLVGSSLVLVIVLVVWGIQWRKRRG